MALPPSQPRFPCFQVPQLSTLTARLTLPKGARQVSTCVLWAEASPGAHGPVPKGCDQNLHLWVELKSGQASRGTHCMPCRAGNTPIRCPNTHDGFHSQGPPGCTLWSWNWDPRPLDICVQALCTKSHCGPKCRMPGTLGNFHLLIHYPDTVNPMCEPSSYRLSNMGTCVHKSTHES